MTDPIVKSIRLKTNSSGDKQRKALNLLAKQGKLRIKGATLSISDVWFLIARKVGVVAESRVSEYPVPPTKPLPKIYQRTRKDGTTYLSKFKSMRQQAYVIRKMQTEGAYTRTGTLGNSINSAVKRKTPTLFIVEIGSNVPYAPYVIGEPEDQAPIHADRWSPLSEDVGSAEAQVQYQDVIQTEVEGIVNAILGAS